eukprot:5054495-Lingulodinium_polyedra.AAC.1
MGMGQRVRSRSVWWRSSSLAATSRAGFARGVRGRRWMVARVRVGARRAPLSPSAIAKVCEYGRSVAR